MADTEQQHAFQAEEEAEASGRLEAAYQEAQAKAEQHWDQLVRIQADMDNAKKRHLKEIASARKYAVVSVLSDVLPALDALEQACQGALDTEHEEGLRLISKLFVEALGRHGMAVLDPVSEAFDPSAHEAVAMQASAELPPHQVLSVVQKGYRVHERIVRPARVVVSKAVEPPHNPTEPSST